MEIKISKKEIFGEVEKRTSLEGLAASDNYDIIWADESRGELLDSYWIEGYTAIVLLLKRYISGSTIDYTLSTYDDDEEISITAEMPARYNTSLGGSINTSLKMMIACNIVGKWLKIVNPDASTKYEEEAQAYSEDIKSKLTCRNSPNHKYTDASIDGEDIGCACAEFAMAVEDNEVFGQEWNSNCTCSHCDTSLYDRDLCINR
jgi:hypothetical protein